MDLHRTLLKDVILPKIKSVFVIDYYEGVRGLLESRADFPYNEIFANPRVRTRTEIIWSTDTFSSAPKLLSDLKEQEKEYYSYLLFREIESLRTLIETLKNEEGGVPLSDLLAKTISNIDEKSVYCGDDKVVLVNWGIIPRQPGLLSAGIFRSGNFIGGWDKEHSVNPIHTISPEVDEKESAEVLDNDEAIRYMEEPEQTEVDDESIASDDIDEDVISEDNPEKPDVEVAESDLTKVVEVPEPPAKVSVAIEPSAKEEVKRENVKEEKPADGYKADYGWTDMFKNFWNGLKFLFRKLWWILLALLLVLLCLIGFKDCQGPIGQVNPFYSPLPSKSVIMPIEDGAVELSEDGMYQVATDRLNIILEKKNDGTMLEWAKAFKKAYPSSDFEIKYYNEDTYFLQIKVPSDKRIKTKNELKSILSDFDFDVFEESVFNSEFVADDPALEDPRASWYLKPIGAKEAWDLTLGDEEVIVAVVDNGFDLGHPEFADKIVNPYNVLTQNDQLRPVVTRRGVNAHGTHVAATAVGNCNNADGLLGIAPNCKLMPIQVGNDNPDGSMGNTAIVEGVLYAINNGADVVNLSIGMYVPDCVKAMSDSEQLNYIASSHKIEESMWDNVFRQAQNKNCIIVLAAGNDSIISGVDPKKRDSNTIRVSAVSPKLEKANFSNYGIFPNINRNYSTVSAPGVAIYSAAPDGKYQYMQGTSMAAPIVSGAVALLKSANHDLSAEEIISILKETGRTVDPTIGPLINIGKAVNVAMGNTAPPVDCAQIRNEIDSLKARIDSLSRLCPHATAPADTLKYDDVINDPRSLDGTWKSTTPLVCTSDQTPIELYMKFNNLEGELIIINNNLRYTAPLKATVVDNQINITQAGPATSPDSSSNFVQYEYECSPDRKRNLFCIATCINGKVEFNLVRIK